jgi:hypothetical protein
MLIVAEVAFLVVHDNVIVVAALQETVLGAENEDMDGLFDPCPPPDDPPDDTPPDADVVVDVDEVLLLPPPHAVTPIAVAATTAATKGSLAVPPRRWNVSLLTRRSCMKPMMPLTQSPVPDIRSTGGRFVATVRSTHPERPEGPGPMTVRHPASARCQRQDR